MNKPSIRYTEEYLTTGDIVIFKDKSVKIVDSFDADRHIVEFHNEKPLDLLAIYDDIEQIAFSHAEGKTTLIHLSVAVFAAIYAINHQSKYKAYLETIEAYLKGDEDHYISEYVEYEPHYGEYPRFGLDNIKLAVDSLINSGHVKTKVSRRGKTYYVVRKDRKRWKI